MEISKIRSISTSITNKAGALAKDSDIFCIVARLRDYIAHWLDSMLESFYISGTLSRGGMGLRYISQFGSWVYFRQFNASCVRPPPFTYMRGWRASNFKEWRDQ